MVVFFLMIFRFSFANDIVRGLTYLHSHYMVHGCLKIENCLVDDRWTVKLTGKYKCQLSQPMSIPLFKTKDAISFLFLLH